MAGPRRILVVDDDPIARDVAGTSLRAQGYEVVGAARLAQALEAALAIEPHLVLSDVVLPDGTGEDLANALREELPAHKRPIVILMSAFSKSRLAEQRAMRERTGAVAFLTKPFSVPALLALVAQQLPPGAPGPDGTQGVPAAQTAGGPEAGGGSSPTPAAAGAGDAASDPVEHIPLFQPRPKEKPPPRHGAAPVTLEDRFGAGVGKSLLLALVDAWRKRWTGTIAVRREGGDKPIEKRFAVEHGQVIWATTTLADEKLGRVLLRLGWLPRDQYEPTLQEAARTRRRHGEILVEKGLLTLLQLQDALLQQVERIVVNTLGWPDGIYTLGATSGRLDTTQRVVASPVPRLVARAFRETIGAERLDQLLAEAATHRLVRAAALSPEVLEELAPGLEERPLLETLAGPAAVTALLATHPDGPEAARPFLATLLALGLAVPAGREAETAAPAPPAPRPPARPGPPSGAPDGQPPVEGPTRLATDEAGRRALEAEAAFEAGCLAAERGDLDAAAGALARAVDLCPHEGEYRAWAAFVQALSARAAFDRSLERVAQELEVAAAATPTAPAVFDLIERVIRLRISPDPRLWS